MTLTPQLIQFLVYTAATFALVAAARKIAPKLDGHWPVLFASVCGGIALQFASALMGGPGVGGWLGARALVTQGVAAGLLSFGGANGWTWLTSKLPAPVAQEVEQALTPRPTTPTTPTLPPAGTP